MSQLIGEIIEKAKDKPGNLTRAELRALLALEDPGPLSPPPMN